MYKKTEAKIQHFVQKKKKKITFFSKKQFLKKGDQKTVTLSSFFLALAKEIGGT